MMLPQWSGTIATGALVTWMIILTVKHVVADFFLQNSWMAKGKDSRTGWLLPLTVHCLVHGALATILFAALVPRLWFLGMIDFVVHFCIDRTKGFCVSHLAINNAHQWFWWLIGIDQALHHLTDFAWAVLVASNP
jgi:Protein of unknown function (DUF3307)